MSRRPRYPKTDENQAEIVEQLKMLGLTAIDVSRLPVPALDLFVGGWSAKARAYAWVQVEIKTQDGELNANEEAYFTENPHLPIIIARNVEDILDWFGILVGSA